MSIKLDFLERNSFKLRNITKFHEGNYSLQANDNLIQEVPVAISFNGVSYTTMMCTPTDLEEFAIGFSITEGIVERYSDIHDVEIYSSVEGITADLSISNKCIYKLKEKKRSLAGTTGCGLCGTERLKGILRVSEPVPSSATVHIAELERVTQELEQHQLLSKTTGASHAAAYFSSNGRLLAIYEDVGRHIALDKLAGWYVIHKPEPGGFILVTSRASFEMVQKVAAIEVESLIAISAATELAVELAEQLNMTLIGFCRNGNATAYSHAERISTQVRPLALC